MSSWFQLVKKANDYSNRQFQHNANTHSTTNTECCAATPLSSFPKAMKDGHQDMQPSKLNRKLETNQRTLIYFINWSIMIQLAFSWCGLTWESWQLNCFWLTLIIIIWLLFCYYIAFLLLYFYISIYLYLSCYK